MAADVDFNYMHNNRGGYYFTIHSSTNGDTPAYYVVDFGDCNDTYFIKTSIQAVNVGIIHLHDINTKTVFLKKKNSIVSSHLDGAKIYK